MSMHSAITAAIEHAGHTGQADRLARTPAA